MLEVKVVTLLFWNLGKNSSTLPHLPCLVQKHQLDIILLAECPWDLDSTVSVLDTLAVGTYREEVKSRAKTRAITRLGATTFTHIFTGIHGRLAVWSLLTPNPPSNVLIAGVHLVSKMGGIGDADQALAANRVIEELYDVEDRYSQNTVLIGDFNMHPYDNGMTHVTGVHGLMTRELAKLPARTHDEKLWRRFYNPMWGLFGDTTPGPAGSFYWRSSVPSNTHWQMLDQVLVRPSLITRFNSVEILGSDGNHDLVSSDGAPDIKHLSDHLPVLFKLDI
jgi:endonuclease/exonuclease/phosphatase family metal-dependent hydrolase